MKCKKCGNEFEGVFCPQCGTKIDGFVGGNGQGANIPRVEQNNRKLKSTKKSKLLLIASIISSLYLVFIFFYFGGVMGIDGNFSLLVGGLALAIAMPHIICVTLATIFSWIGWVNGERWTALTSGILYAVSILFMFIYAPFVIIQLVLSFVAYTKMEKNKYIEVDEEYETKTEGAKEKKGKPYYKTWAFWVIAIILMIFISAMFSDDLSDQSKDPTKVTKQTEITENKKKEVTKEIAKEYILTSGNYIAGIDIPVGKCNIEALSGRGNLISSNMFDGGINEMFGIDDGAGMYNASFKGLKLSEKTVLTLNNKLKVKLIYTKIDKGYIGRTYDEKKSIVLTNGNYEAGVDFPAGTYKIMAISGNGNLISSNMFDGGVNAMFGIDDGSGLYNDKINNVTFKKKTSIAVNGIMGTLKIKLIPEKRVINS